MTELLTTELDDVIRAEAESLNDYLDHLGWSENPFGRPPHPDEYIPEERDHLADAVAAINSGTDPVVIRSERHQTGKTTLLKELVRAYQDRWTTQYLPLQNRGEVEPLRVTADAFQIDSDRPLPFLRDDLREHVSESGPVLLAFDDVPFDSPSCLTGLNALIDIPGVKLVVAGQTDRYTAAESARAHRFRTTVGYEYELTPFDLVQTKQLVAARIETAKNNEDALNPFRNETLHIVHQKADGRPGVILRACSELVSLGAYQFSHDRGHEITEMLARAIDYPD